MSEFIQKDNIIINLISEFDLTGDSDSDDVIVVGDSNVIDLTCVKVDDIQAGDHETNDNEEKEIIEISSQIDDNEEVNEINDNEEEVNETDTTITTKKRRHEEITFYDEIYDEVSTPYDEIHDDYFGFYEIMEYGAEQTRKEMRRAGCPLGNCFAYWKFGRCSNRGCSYLHVLINY